MFVRSRGHDTAEDDFDGNWGGRQCIERKRKTSEVAKVLVSRRARTAPKEESG